MLGGTATWFRWTHAPVLRFALLLMVIGFVGVAHATTDACLTWEGVWVAPWTDGQDPACGDDCGAEAELASDRICSTADEGCSALADGEELLRMPAPQGDDRPGPRCLKPGPECSPAGGGGSAFGLGGALFINAEPVHLPRRAPGTLPGAPRPMTTHVAWERDLQPATPPPRA